MKHFFLSLCSKVGTNEQGKTTHSVFFNKRDLFQLVNLKVIHNWHFAFSHPKASMKSNEWTHIKTNFKSQMLVFKKSFYGGFILIGQKYGLGYELQENWSTLCAIAAYLSS